MEMTTSVRKAVQKSIIGLEYEKQYMNCRGAFRTQSNIYDEAKSR